MTAPKKELHAVTGGLPISLSRIALALYVVFVVLLAATIFLVGPVTQIGFSHDFFAIVEGGWKIVQGYQPYTDFHTLIGPLPYLIVALGILIVGPVAGAMTVSIAITLFPVAALAWYLLSSRFTPLGTFCAAAYLALLWCAPYPLHFPFFLHSYAMIYNRQSYVLLCLLFLSVAVHPRENLYLKGLLLGLLFFFKVPYFVAGVGLVGFYLLFTGITRREVAWASAGFITSFLPVFIYLHGSGTIVMVMFMVAAAKCRTPDVLASNVALFWTEFPFAISFVILLAACSRWTTSQVQPETPFFPHPWKERVQLLAEPLVVLFAAFLTEMASSPLITVTDIPLVCAYAFLVLDRVFRDSGRSAWRAYARYGGPTLVLGLILILPMGLRAVAGIADIIYLELFPPLYLADTRIFAPGMLDFQTLDRCQYYPPGVLYADKINDGINLIHKHPELDHAVIATLDFSDPFSFSLQRHSPAHMPLGLQYGFNVTEEVAPNPEWIFKGCQAIMAPKYPDDPVQTFYILRSKYRDYLTQNFVLLDQSPLWFLLKRK